MACPAPGGPAAYVVAVPAPPSDDDLYGELAEYGLHLLERLFEALRVDIIDGLAPALNALDASAAGHPPA